MRIAIPKERLKGEARVAASAEVVKKLVGLGFEVVVETGAGADASMADDVFKEAGAEIAKDEATALKDADVVVKVNPPQKAEIGKMKKGAILIAQLQALTDHDTVNQLKDAGLTSFAMELVPRISRAQSMDVLSSQANLAGYKSVLLAAEHYGRGVPMMMTAAGSVPAAKAFIMGVGVAGLQAIATAKRLGAAVTATDVRPATKEQVQSLGGKFLEVDPEMEKEAETAGGYAKEMPKEYFEKQRQKVREHLPKQDIVITTALVPGKKAPVLISKDMVETMKPGAVIVDLAAGQGGNVEGSKPDEVVKTANGVIILGPTNLPAALAETASALYAKNVLNFLSPHVDAESKTLSIDWDDEVIKGAAVTRDGEVVNERVREAMGGGAAPAKAEKPAPADDAGDNEKSEGEAS